MTTSQFFVYKRPIAWTALVGTFLWGTWAYLSMPQRHDPDITVGTAVIVTPFPGARAEEVEQQVTRKIENRVRDNPMVETVRSVSRQGLSIVFVELYDSVRKADPVWQDLENRLQTMADLPKVDGVAVVPKIDKEFGDTVSVMLTVSAPEVTDFEIERRAASIRDALGTFRAGRPSQYQANRLSAVLVYPNTVARSYVLWIGQSLRQRLLDSGLGEDVEIVEAPSTGCIDFQLPAHRSLEELIAELERWQRDTLGTGIDHPDIWPGFIVRDLSKLEGYLRRNPREPQRVPERFSYRDLRRYADLIADRLKQSPNIGKVDILGVQEEAIYLYYSGRRFAAFDINPGDVAQRLEKRNVNLPGGRVELPDLNLVVTPSGEFTSEQDIGGVVLDVRQGYPLYLRDLVDIVRGYEDPPAPMNFRTIKVDAKHPPTARLPGEHTPEVFAETKAVSAPGGDAGAPPAAAAAHAARGETEPLPQDYRLQTTRALTIAIRQLKGSKVAEFGRDIDEALASLKAILPDDLQVERTSNEPAVVERKIDDFNRNLIEAVVIVILVALVFMEWRSALLVAFSIPLTVAMTLGFCQLLGIDLQQVSIAALIIALGLLVDDPVVAGDAINRELAHGQPRDVAAWLGPQKLARAILYATITNCVAFLPLLLVAGKTGEFIYSLPVVVTASLVSSRIVSMTFMPLLGYYVLKGQKGFEAGLKDGRGSTFARYYNGFSEWCLSHKAVSLTVCFAVLAACVACLPLIGTSFFPKDFHDIFSVNVFLAEGSPIRQTRDEVLRVLETIDKLEGRNIRSYTTFVGAGGPRFWLSIVPEQRADNYGQILVHTVDRHATSKIVERLKESLPPQCTARVTIEQLETGPPVGLPVQVRLFGDDKEQLRTLAASVRAMMRAIPGADNIHDDWEPEVLQITMSPEPDRTGMTRVTREDVGVLVSTGLSGYSPTSLREGDRQIPITLRLRSDERTRYVDLENITIVSSTTNNRVPVNQIADFKTELVAPKILRRDYERCLTVKCDAVPGVLPSKIVAELEQRLQAASPAWPPGYRYEFGGEKHEQEKGFASLTRALVISLAAIYFVLVLQFNSVTKPLVVFAAVPFGLLAGLMGLLIFKAPLGFMAFLGVASLAGVIVSHIIVLFDYIEEAHERGETLHRAVIDSALVRLRPVLVTVLATVGGLIPLAIEGGPLWEPMCYVLIVGLLAATLVTKVIVPVLYVLFVENLKIIRWDQPAHAGPPTALSPGETSAPDSHASAGPPANTTAPLPTAD